MTETNQIRSVTRTLDKIELTVLIIYNPDGCSFNVEKFNKL